MNVMKRMFFLPLILAALIGCQAPTPEIQDQTDDDIALWTKDDGRCLLGYDSTIPPGVSLPDRVYLKTKYETHNRAYYFAVRTGMIFAKVNEERTGEEGDWVRLNLPEELEGSALEIAADDINLIAINEDRRVFTMNGGFGPMKLFWWSDKWGNPIWLGPGIDLPEEIRDWTYSVISPQEDKKYIDTAGNLHNNELAKDSHIWYLDEPGQHLTFLDPWLPSDHSYGMGTPFRGRFQARTVASSGSSVFIINDYGDMYTRFYDFDMSGSNRAFFQYSYEDQSDKLIPRVQLPCFDWVRQPKIPGTITDNLSIYKVGLYGINRIMRVEGKNEAGHTGFWEKNITDMSSAAWTFHYTGEPLTGTLLENSPEDRSEDTLGTSGDRTYTRAMADGWTATIADLNCYASPAALRVTTDQGHVLNLTLHTTDSLRQKARAPGFDDDPRKQYAVIQIDPSLLDDETLPGDLKEWIGTYLEKEFTSYILEGTADKAVLKQGSVLQGVFKTTGLEMTFLF